MKESIEMSGGMIDFIFTRKLLANYISDWIFIIAQ